MKNKKLTRILATGVAGLGLVGGLTGVLSSSGCESMSNEALTGAGAIGESVQVSPKEAEESYNSGYFACNYIRDFDGDKILDFNECVNIKRKFRRDEKITLVARLRLIDIQRGAQLESIISDSNGNISLLDKDSMDKVMKLPDPFFCCSYKGGLSIGEYIATFSIKGGKYLGRIDFEVTE